MKKLVKKIFDYEDFKEAGFNFALIWVIAQIANIISEKFFHFSLNQFNSIEHLAIGVLLGTLAYRKMGGGVKGMIAAFIAGSLFNVGWEFVELTGNIFSYSETLIDIITDIAFVYVGSNVFAPLIEKVKKKFGRKRKKKKKYTNKKQA